METPYTPRNHPWADMFRRDASYRNQRSRGTPDWLLILTVEGAGRAGCPGHEFSTAPGDVILFEPHAPQCYGTDSLVSRWALLWVHFQPRPHWQPWLQWPLVERGLRRIALKNADVRQSVQKALRECLRFCRQRENDFALNALERALLGIHSTRNPPVLDERIRKAVDHMAEDLALPFSVPHLARQCGLSVSRLSHLFRDQTGVPPQRYQETLRLERAAQLLGSSGLSVSEIARETGHANVFYFSTRFKKRFGLSPSAYRKKSATNERGQPTTPATASKHAPRRARAGSSRG